MYLMTRYFINKFGKIGVVITYITGVIGTPIHELSHALFCIIFGHKIEKIKLFQIGNDGTIGYVNHSYNKKNIYHRIGNFFIGIAPIIGGTAMIYLILYFGVPELFGDIWSEIIFVEYLNFDLLDINFYSGLFDICNSVFSLLFSFGNLFNFRWWICILLSIFIAMHMLISSADIKGALDGLIFVLLTLLILNIVAYFVGFISYITEGILMFVSLIIPILFICLILNFILVIFGYIYSKKKGK